MTEYDYDLFTIGAGSGGVRASRLAASYGARVAVAEEFRVGGTCVIRGCVPKKLFVYASEFGHAISEAAGYGWTADKARFDWKTLVANKDAEIARLSGLYVKNLKAAGAEIIDSRAVLKDAHTIHLLKENRTVTAAKILVATGGHPRTDELIPGHALGVTSNEAFHLETFPRRVVIAGGGYIAVEFAFIFAGLGAEVTLVYRRDRLLREFDEDISASVHREMENAGIRLVTNTVFTSIEDLGGGQRRVNLTNGEAVETDLVFWAVGRRPNTAGLGLEAAGVTVDGEGAVIVDEFSRTNVPHIFAVGDVTNRVQLTPVAIREGAAFAETEFNKTPMRVDYTFIPKAVFAQPPAATVGYSEAEAREKFGAVDIYKTDFRPMKATLSGAKARTMMKLVVEQKTQRVLGIHIVGEGAAEMIQCLAIAVKAGLTKRDFDETMALHPTSAEELVLMRGKA
ncbi:MAG: glutathione-disulfide reductase [Parvularculaceae bacterium]|nr:glutathione-disulfide reductase [Parvularculaceae bacterium]